MNTKQARISLLLLSIMVSFVRCGDGPTQPAPQPTPVPTPVPTPAPLDLNGAWSGSIEINAPSNWPSCPFREDVQATLSHSQGKILGSIRTCWGTFFLAGTLGAGNRLSVSVRRGMDLVTTLHGTASSRVISVSGYRIALVLTR